MAVTKIQTKQLPVVTTVANPGVDTNIPSEKAVRAAFQPLDGWILASTTWTYASATTFTAPGDQTAVFRKGTKLKLTQTSVKYFVVVASSYSAPNTTVTFTAGDDYTLVNAAITSPNYSHIENPQDWPDWFNYLPTYSATGSMTFTEVTTEIAKFRVRGKSVEIQLRAYGTTGGTANYSLLATLPIAHSEIFPVAAAANYRDATAGIQPVGTGGLLSATARVNRADGTLYGLGTGRYLVLSGTYAF